MLRLHKQDQAARARFLEARQINTAKPSPHAPRPTKSTPTKSVYAPATIHATTDASAPAAPTAALHRKYLPSPAQQPRPMAASMCATLQTRRALYLHRQAAIRDASVARGTAAFLSSKIAATARTPLRSAPPSLLQRPLLLQCSSQPSHGPR